MLQNLLVLAIDESLGRLDYSMLSDQARLEIFFGDCTAEQKFDIGIILKESDPSSYVDFCDWDDEVGSVVTCDEEGNVVGLDLDESNTHHPDPYRFNFAYLPPKLETLKMVCVGFDDDMSMEDLPEGLKTFLVSGKFPCSAFKTKHLPRRKPIRKYIALFTQKAKIQCTRSFSASLV